MLNSFARHGFFDLELQVTGDLEVDTHHTVEDVGIVLGQAIREALGDKKGIVRYGSQLLPMDESLVLCALDLCGRPCLGFDMDLDRERVGDFETEMVREFFYAVSYGAMMNLHIRRIAGGNCHHLIEAAFKAFARALDQAVGYDSRLTDVLSTKGEDCRERRTADMQLYPAIDMKNGQCVRLRQGAFADMTVYGTDPAQMALKWQEAGASFLHLVDLDGALARPFRQ